MGDVSHLQLHCISTASSLPVPLQVEVFTNPDNVSLAVVDFEVASDNLELLVAECRYRVGCSVPLNENPQDVAW